MNGYEWIDFFKRVIVKGEKEPKKIRNVFDVYKKTNVVDYWPMVKELAKRTGLPKFICRLVYEAEGDILMDLGIIKTGEDK